MAELGIKKSSPALVGIAWLIVVAPTLWGLTYTVQNAMKLFKPAPAAAAPAATAPAAPAAPTQAPH